MTDLVFGYMKHLISSIETDDNTYSYPIELNCIIINCLGNILLRFDTFHENYKSCITNYGYTVMTPNSPGIFPVGCSWAMKEGSKYNIKLKCIQPGYDGFGILSNIDECKDLSCTWWTTMSAPNYFWYENCGVFGTSISLKNIQNLFAQKWEANDIIGIKVDCAEWKVYFHINDKIVAHLQIEPNYNYHVALCLQNTNCKYQLLP